MLFNPYQVEEAIDDVVPALALILVIMEVEEAVTEFSLKPMAEVAGILFDGLFD